MTYYIVFYLFFIISAIVLLNLKMILKKGFEHNLFIRYSEFKIYDTKEFNLVNYQYLVNLISDSNYNYFLLIKNNEKIIFCQQIKQNNISKKLLEENNFDSLIYKVPEKNICFNALLGITSSHKTINFFENSVYMIVLIIPVIIITILLGIQYTENAIGIENIDYAINYTEWNLFLLDILFLTFSVNFEIFLFCIIIILLLYLTIIIWLHDLKVYMYNIILGFFMFLMSSFLILCFWILYNTTSSILKFQNPSNKNISKNTFLLEAKYKKIMNFEEIYIKDEKAFKIGINKDFIYYQNFKKNEKNFFKEEEKIFNKNFLDSNCQEVFSLIKEDCNKKNIETCKKEDIITALIISNEFFNFKNTEKFPLKYSDIKHFNTRKIDINKDINIKNLLNKCKIIVDLSSYKSSENTLKILLIQRYKNSEDLDERKYIKELFYNLDIKN